MELSERIKEVINYTDLSVRAFAIKCNLNQPTVDRYIKNQAVPTSTALISIVKTFPEISCEWLLKGEGNMLSAENQNEEIIKFNNRLLRLNDMLASLQEVINNRDDTIEILTNKIKELENQLKLK